MEVETEISAVGQMGDMFNCYWGKENQQCIHDLVPNKCIFLMRDCTNSVQS